MGYGRWVRMSCGVAISDRDTSNARTEEGWACLRPSVANADAFGSIVGSAGLRGAHRRRTCDHAVDRSFERQELRAQPSRRLATSPAQVWSTVRWVPPSPTSGEETVHTDRCGRTKVSSADRRCCRRWLVIQVSRWTAPRTWRASSPASPRRCPDFAGRSPSSAGPDVSGVSDDPEGAGARGVSSLAAARCVCAEAVHLVCLPMDDVDENAHLVNALQRHASVIVQKSLA